MHFSDDDAEFDDGGELSEAEGDALFKHNRRRQERLHRAIEERMARGEDAGEAFDGAMRDEGIIDLPGEPPLSEMAQELLEAWDEEEPDEPWRESLPAAVRDDEEGFDAFLEREHHPLLERAMDLLLRLHQLLSPADERFPYLFTTLQEGRTN